MEPQSEEIRDQQKESWNQFSTGWKKWDDLIMGFLKPFGDEIISMLKIKDDDVVLDIAAGTGEPGLTIASMLKGGKVISTDLAEGMLAVAREKAERRGITNFETLVSDASQLPFGDNTFDAVSCRFGFMFFPDMLQAAREMTRVLKPGGRIAASVWNVPEKNFWNTAIMGAISKHIEIPQLPPGAPGMFRCAEAGLVPHLFRQAGLKNISENEVNSKYNVGTADVYWNMMTEVGASIVAALSTADDEVKGRIRSEVFELLNQKYPEGKIAMDAGAWVISAEK
ncbi:class I SAM-dependent methyltransferase [Flavihumibacter sp. R14]|nr:class I SAM-dependent methyltransferase [Flavihumibacter soli]